MNTVNQTEAKGKETNHREGKKTNRFLSFCSSILLASRSSFPIRILSWKMLKMSKCLSVHLYRSGYSMFQQLNK